MSAKKNKKIPPCDPAGLATLCHAARNLLAFHAELGLDHYPATPGLEKLFVQDKPASFQPTSAPAKKKPTHQAEQSTKLSREDIARQLETISNKLSSCTICNPVPHDVILGQGNPVPRLFVLGDWQEGSEVQKGLLWGQEEDNLFWKMMEAIGLDKESVYVTNCLKCLQKVDTSVHLGRVQDCYSYLEQELLAIQPSLICTMGEAATWLLLKKKAPLFKLRGRFHHYRYPHGSEAKVMPTYHPRFLLQHQEMKRATWMDLQAVQKKLASSVQGE